MKPAIALTCVLGLFLLGGVIGGLGLHLHHGMKYDGPRHGGHDGGRGGLPQVFHFLDGSERLGWLDLTDEQRAKIDEIQETGRREMDALREELRPRIDKQAHETREKIDAVLNEEQRAKLAEFLEREGPRRRRHKPPPP